MTRFFSVLIACGTLIASEVCDAQSLPVRPLDIAVVAYIGCANNLPADEFTEEEIRTCARWVLESLQIQAAIKRQEEAEESDRLRKPENGLRE